MDEITPGMMFAAPANEKFAIIRVLRREKPGLDSWIIVLMKGRWPSIPTAAEAFKSGYFKYSIHDSERPGQICKGYVKGQPPAEFQSIGIVAVTDQEREFGLPLQLFPNWPFITRILHKEEEAEFALRDLTVAAKTQEANAPGHLERLRDESMFNDWIGYRSSEIVLQVRNAMLGAIDALQALGSNPDKTQTRKILRGLIKTINTLNQRLRIDIDTVEREAILGVFSDMALAVGIVEQIEKLADDRDW